ncbi:Polyketide biosynthesis protein BaeE [Includes: Malonyl CoA-acyl carrier protein transacylase] (fragment) [Nitrospira japonica]|uniref:Malonyl CoA-acyl carrier protein transacylase n=1 Tax=Nitrospira japonica TaxID=1325564 RepID=A0A1W1IAI8_9BACT
MLVVAFAGQGSQRAGMGSTLFPRYRDVVNCANRILGYSLQDLCAAGGPRLTRTEFTQPAVFVVNKLLYEDTLANDGIVPDVMIGHSLGEINALHATGVLDFEEALQLVKARGAFMAEHNGNGAMVALVGERDQLLHEVSTNESEVYVANDNSPRQIVVAGTKDGIKRLSQRLSLQQAATVIPLAVSGPFHCPLMAGVDDRMGEYLEGCLLREPCIPVVSNYSAQPYRSDVMRTWLAKQVVSTVRWLETIQYLSGSGPLAVREIATSPVLTPLIEDCLKRMRESVMP